MQTSLKIKQIPIIQHMVNGLHLYHALIAYRLLSVIQHIHQFKHTHTHIHTLICSSGAHGGLSALLKDTWTLYLLSNATYFLTRQIYNNWNFELHKHILIFWQFSLAGNPVSAPQSLIITAIRAVKLSFEFESPLCLTFKSTTKRFYRNGDIL